MMANARKTIVLPAVLVAGLATTSCQDGGGGGGGGSDFGPKTGIGAALGAAGGGLLGAAAGGSATGIAAGVLLGGLLGGATGSVLDDRDKRTASTTTQQALESKPSGSATTWRNPDTGSSSRSMAKACNTDSRRTFARPISPYLRSFAMTRPLREAAQK